jgi:hypothetical protein
MADGRGIEGTDGFRMVVGVSCVGWYGWGMGYRYLTSGTCASPTICKNALYTAIPVVNYIGISTRLQGGRTGVCFQHPPTNPHTEDACSTTTVHCLGGHSAPQYHNPPFGGQRGQPPPFTTTTHHAASPWSHVPCIRSAKVCPGFAGRSWYQVRTDLHSLPSSLLLTFALRYTGLNALKLVPFSVSLKRDATR